MINFIGLGAQKSGTSWAYTCLYDHPEVCAPVKEIHFFSRPRFSSGRAWYEGQFSGCPTGKKRGEFSTSYLYSPETPERIHAWYPEARLIAILRNPLDRAFSQYRNAIKAGEIPETMSFNDYAAAEPSVLGQGLYAEQIARYDQYFSRDQFLILIYEDIRRDPVSFMKTIYGFLGIDSTFVSSFVFDEINVARTPRHVFVDRVMHHVSEGLRRSGLDRVVHLIRKTGLPDLVRALNTKPRQAEKHSQVFDRAAVASYFSADVTALSRRLGRDLNQEWGISH
jgi:hypothetical protein